MEKMLQILDLEKNYLYSTSLGIYKHSQKLIPKLARKLGTKDIFTLPLN